MLYHSTAKPTYAVLSQRSLSEDPLAKHLKEIRETCDKQHFRAVSSTSGLCRGCAATSLHVRKRAAVTRPGHQDHVNDTLPGTLEGRPPAKGRIASRQMARNRAPPS